MGEPSIVRNPESSLRRVKRVSQAAGDEARFAVTAEVYAVTAKRRELKLPVFRDELERGKLGIYFILERMTL